MLWYSTRLFSKLICTQSAHVGALQKLKSRTKSRGNARTAPTASSSGKFLKIHLKRFFSPTATTKCIGNQDCQMPDHCVLDHIVSLEILHRHRSYQKLFLNSLLVGSSLTFATSL